MKIKFEKQPHGTLKIEVAVDTGKKPLVFEVRPGELKSLVDILEVGMRGDKFKFEMEI